MNKNKAFVYYGIVQSCECPNCQEAIPLNAHTLKIILVCPKCEEVFDTEVRKEEKIQ